MPRYIYTIQVIVEVAGDNASEAIHNLRHALLHSKKEEIVMIETTITGQRDEEPMDQ